MRPSFKILGRKLRKKRPILTLCIRSFVPRQIFMQKRLSVNLRCFLYQFEKLSSRNYCGTVSTLPPRSTSKFIESVFPACKAMPSAEVKEPHCGLFSGKAFSIATPPSLFFYLCITLYTGRRVFILYIQTSIIIMYAGKPGCCN